MNLTPGRDPFTPGLLQRIPPPARAVVLRASRIGDFLCAVPAFRALRAALPSTHLSIITLPILHDLAARLPYFDRVIPFPGYPGIAEQFFDAHRTTAFFQEMQAQGLDLAVQMQGSGVYSNPFTLMLGARHTAGFVRPGDPPGVLAAALPLPAEGHEIERTLALPVFLGAPAQDTRTEFPLWPEDRALAADLLAGAEPPLIGVHPAARALTRRWPPVRFGQAAGRLWQQRGGTVIVVGEAEESAAARQAITASGARCLDLAGRTSLPVLGAVFERLAVFLTNDTGPAHIAYALGTPTVTIWGGDDPKRYGPPPGDVFRVLAHPVPCRPCAYEACPIGYACLEHVTVDQAVQAAAALF